MGRSILAVVVGAVLAVIVIVAVQMVSHLIYPPPPGFDMNNLEALHELFAQAPVGALLLVALSYFLGTAAGAWFAARLAPRAPAVHAVLIAGLFLVMDVLNLLKYPHPAWFWPVSLAMFPLGAWVGLKLARRPSAA